MEQNISQKYWDLLISDIHFDADNFPQTRPLVAHYTSVEVLEKIISSNELWFSNPLFMNDYHEIRMGVQEGKNAFDDHEDLLTSVFEDPEHWKLFRNAFIHYFEKFSNEEVMDVYAFCMSYHDERDNDRRLSMWRGYGGNGRGVALVFDLSKLENIEDSPFAISRVRYVEPQEVKEWLKSLMVKTAGFIETTTVPPDQIHYVAYMLFLRIKVAALFTKHKGFEEEREWRVAYLRERNEEYMPEFSHIVTGKGVEPKLRFKLEPKAGVTGDGFSLKSLVHRIILGPMIGSALAHEALCRMLAHHGAGDLRHKVCSSTIPYRA